ncbi:MULTISPECIES: MmcQ/YjbR family DNA-binding protein [unclassified Arthrobacter]|uniref:MmcQ/YjbR family DNA-binding protein n=1 Tax=unclassified Arthrobacter TaxID=235627 RepID=UPI001492D9CB|nr:MULTISPECIES: MmcQ/YjbR family DNA-binding protein [unclassified Arthrobacter]MBE0008244.1 MmcQ/YjbR family DNA-binding protein [Arthrobacter sp. AET 35A]NOJ60592.1 MmcQ/YjbR family DNA-binding protein [Arthrobacter sp. 260]NOJ61983.1 MmcQ/YjbR family DNA-binding protein [Arthrobacter sp. 147(2020)]
MDADELRQFCLGLPGTFEDFPFGPVVSVFKVSAAGGTAKMFALSDLSDPDLSVSLKCEPLIAEALRAAHPEIVGAYHLNKTHWNGVSCTGELSAVMIREMIEDSYDLVVASLPLRDRIMLGWSRWAADDDS